MMNRGMRRFRQALTQEEVEQILRDGKVAVIGVSGDDDYPYTVPVNYVYADGFVYIHSAAKGHKIDALHRNPKCSICIIDKDDIIPNEFTTYFRSVIAFGRAEFVEDPDEKIELLRLLCKKYSPGIDPTHEIDKFLKAVALIRIKLEKVTGKEAIELVEKRL